MMIIQIQHLLEHRDDMRRMLARTNRLVSCVLQLIATRALTRIELHPEELAVIANML